MTLDINKIFVVTRNEERKRFEFDRINGGIGYLVSFSECNNIDDAWIAVYKALKLEPKKTETKP